MAILTRIRENYGGFEEAVELAGESKLEKYSDRMYQAFCDEYKKADYLTNIEWLLRHYNAAKKMILSVLFFVQTNHLLDKKLQNITFYTSYYSLFNALVSNLFISPYLRIHDVRRISHRRVFSDVHNYFVRADIYSEEIIGLLNELRLMRELYSYHLPLGGTVTLNGKHVYASEMFQKLKSNLTGILQISNLLSFISHLAWEKKIGKIIDEYHTYQVEVDRLFFSFIEVSDHLGKHQVMDDDDYMRQGYVLRKIASPFPISWYITRMCDDLECGWEDGETKTGFPITDVLDFLHQAIDAT